MRFSLPSKIASGLCLLTFTQNAQTQEPGIAPGTGKPIGEASRPLSGLASSPVHFAALTEIRIQAAKAEQAKNFALAEQLWQSSIELEPRGYSNRISLAQLYDRLGREREAIETYRVVVDGIPDTVSAFPTDPRILTRYGVLCQKYGLESDARHAYQQALANDDRQYAHHTPRPLPRNATFKSSKAAAHIISALKWKSVSDLDQAFNNFSIAIATEPDWWLPYYYRGGLLSQMVGQKQNSREDFSKALSLAKGADRAFVKQMAQTKGFPLPGPGTRRPAGTN